MLNETVLILNSIYIKRLITVKNIDLTFIFYGDKV